MIKYSIIIPVYNAEKYITECVNSLLQDRDDYEIIIVDDCSSDNSFEICKKFINEKIKIFKQKQNLGVSAARNLGIDKSRGEYILFVDSDDYVSSDYFNVIENYSDLDLLCFGHYNHIIEENKDCESSMNCSVDYMNENSFNDLFLKSFFASPCNKVYKRDIIANNNIKFDTTCVCYEDFLFNVEYCKYINNFKVINNSLYYYRISNNINPIIKRKWGESFYVSNKVAQSINDFIISFKGEENLANIKRYIYSSFLVELEYTKISNGDYKESMNYVINNKYFNDAVNSIENCGKGLSLYKIAKKLKINFICKLIIEKYIKL